MIRVTDRRGAYRYDTAMGGRKQAGGGHLSGT